MSTRTRIETILVDGEVVSTTSYLDTSRHEHDCDACLFMGRFGDYDLYYCPDSKTLIARRGPEGEYTSLCATTYSRFIASGFFTDEDPIHECYKRLQHMNMA